MGKNGSRRHVAIIERCAMSEVGLRHLLPATGNYQICFFKDRAEFMSALARTPFFSLIYALSAIRAERVECLSIMCHMACTCPSQQRIVLAGNDMEARLISRFSPVTLHGVISKTAPLERVRQQLRRRLNNKKRVNETILNLWYYSYERILNQTEREILYYTALGYPITHIAMRLERNCKSIRAHKFSLMTKLGVDTDAGLFYAADILVQMQQAFIATPARRQQILA